MLQPADAASPPRSAGGDNALEALLHTLMVSRRENIATLAVLDGGLCHLVELVRAHGGWEAAEGATWREAIGNVAKAVPKLC